MTDIKREVLEAEERIRLHVRQTPLVESLLLSRLTGSKVYLKTENFQVSGSFKIRGAMNAYLGLTDEQKKKGIVTASSGNHGSAMAHTLWKTGGEGSVYIPETTSPVKVEALRRYGTDVVIYGSDCVFAEARAREVAAEAGLSFISPYNDLRIVGGQGTVGVELERQLSDIDVILVPVGGGGLISGIAGYMKSVSPSTAVVGCQPENSAIMYHSLQRGGIVEMASKPTVSDGSAGGIEKGSITFEMCRQWVDDFILVTEAEILSAMKQVIFSHHMLIEGAAALSVAALQKEKKRFENKKCVCVLSGARLGADKMAMLV
jgi:threonine dehydratase